MNSDYNEIILRNKPSREPMSFERMKFLCYFVAGILGEVFGFVVVLVFVLGMFGIFK